MNIKPGNLIQGVNDVHGTKPVVGVVVEARSKEIDNKNWCVFSVKMQNDDNKLALYASCDGDMRFIAGNKNAPVEISLVKR